MKEIVRVVVFFIVIFGFVHFSLERKKSARTQEICEDFFNTNNEQCLEDPESFVWYEQSAIAESELLVYVEQVKRIEAAIDERQGDRVSFDYSKYSYTSPFQVERLYGYFGDIDSAPKVVVGGRKTDYSCGFFNGDPGDYSFCLKQEVTDYDAGRELTDTIVIDISNIDEFPKAKAIMDDSLAARFYAYHLTIYGTLISSQSMLRKAIKADLIQFDRYSLEDDDYVRILRGNLVDKRRRELEEFKRERFPVHMPPHIRRKKAESE